MLSHDELLEVQLERARAIVSDSYSKEFSSDADVIKFLLDRLERIEIVNSTAYKTISKIDWAL